MREQAIENSKDRSFDGGLGVAEFAAATGDKVERLKERAVNAFEDGMVDARRLIKRGRYAAEDLVDDTAHRIKKDPWTSVGVTFAAGMTVGIMLGWIFGHRTNRPPIDEDLGF